MKYSSDDLLPMLPALIEMQTHRRWVCWCAIERKGAMTKAPYNPHTGEFARTNDGRTWGTYRQAFETWQRHPNLYSGVGYVFTGQISGIDLDHCVDERGTIEQWARQILILIGSYAEYSPSKTGIHIYVKGKVAQGTRRPVPPGWGARHPKAAVELYSTGRFFTVTGAHIPETSVSLASNQRGIDDLLRRLVPGFDALKRVRRASDWEDAQRWASQPPPDACVPQRTWPSVQPGQRATARTDLSPSRRDEREDRSENSSPCSTPPPPDPAQNEEQEQQEQEEGEQAQTGPPASSAPGPELLTDAELLQKALEAVNGDRFRALYIEGSTRDYVSDSEADMALCNHLAFWTGGDAARMDRLFRASGLYRRKWDERRGQETYGQRTIQRAIATCTEVYQPSQTRSKRERGRRRKGRKHASADTLAATRPGPSGMGVESSGEHAPGETVPDPDRDLREQLEELGVPTTAPWDFVEACLKRGQRGDVSLLAHLFANRLCYDYHENMWHRYAGHAWKRDTPAHTSLLVTDALARVYEQALCSASALSPQQPAKDVGVLKCLKDRIQAIRNRTHTDNVLHRAQGHSKLEVSSAVWDRQPDLLATPDGVLDLRTGELRPGQPEDYLRTVIPTRWEGLDAPAPRFERFLHEIFADRSDAERHELIAFLQRILGYGITGHVSEHRFLMLLGEEGRNGKDTLLSILHHVLGEHAGSVRNEIFIASTHASSPGNATPHLCDLQGKRLAWCSETDKGARFDVAQVKFLTGGGMIPARNMYQRGYTFQPTHLLILLTNNRPHADAYDKAFWERLCLIPFRLRFVEYPSAPNERPLDPDLLASLQAEAPGILAWLVRGCLAWRRDGLQTPASVRHERSSYQQQEDTLGQFLDECCLIAPTATVRASALYERYKDWCKDGNLRCMNHILFGREIAKQFQKQHVKEGNTYKGIALLTEEDGERW